MSNLLSYEELVSEMERVGVKRSLAEQCAAREVAARGGVVNDALRDAGAGFVRVDGPVLAFPIRLVLPWSALCSDNERERPSYKHSGSEIVPYMAKTERFKAARDKVRKIGRDAMTVEGVTFPPLTQDLSFVGRLYTPTGRRVDASNFAKACQDALSTVVYRDDQQLHDVRWVKVGPDVDHPRAEIEIAPL